MDLTSEKDLINQAKSDPQAFGLIFQKHYKEILGYCIKRCANIQLAEDITAETFYKAYNSLWKFSWRNVRIVAWLYRIANNELATVYRKHKLYVAESIELHLEIASDLNLENEIVEAERDVSRHEEFLKIHEVLTQLPIKYQEVITLRFFHDKSMDEIAEILGKPTGTVKSLLSRGLEKIRERLSQDNSQPISEVNVVLDEGREIIK